jgi:hypothetical protein
MATDDRVRDGVAVFAACVAVHNSNPARLGDVTRVIESACDQNPNVHDNSPFYLRRDNYALD